MATCMTSAMVSSAANGTKAAMTKAIHSAHLTSGIRNGACPVEATIAMRNRGPRMDAAPATSDCALAMSALRMSHVDSSRCFVRSMGPAHELAQFETSIVRDLSKTLTRPES